MAIMRSRNPSPSRRVTRTTSQSDNTRVPPVTAEKSPPASRSTGADSPVTALSLTEATPSTTSPSAGMTSLASTSTRSPRLSAADSTVWYSPRALPTSRLACTWRRMERNVAACALPRPSATASAKLANNTVNHNQAEMASTNPGRPAPLAAPSGRRDANDRGEDAADIHDEHHRIAKLHPRIQFAQRIVNRRQDQRTSQECGAHAGFNGKCVHLCLTWQSFADVRPRGPAPAPARR